MGNENPSTSNWRFGAGPVHGNERLDMAVFAERDAPTPIDPSATERFSATELEERITLHQSQKDRIGVSENVDFVLAFYMVHEVPNQEEFFIETEVSHTFLRRSKATIY